MKLTYVGPFDAVTVPLPFGGEVTCGPGGDVEVPDDLAARLLEQEANWRLAASELAKVTRAERKAEDAAEAAEAARSAGDGNTEGSVK